jgi:F-type H+-transporting ATPase subunit b
MPQFDPTWFPSQLFWLAICMAVLYIALSRSILPPLLGVLAQRIATVDGDLARAESLRAEAETTRVNYEQALTKARAHAQGLLAEAERKNKEATEQADAALNQTLAAQAADAEAKLDAQKQKLLASLEPEAAELTALAVNKLTGLAADPARARALIQKGQE